MTSGGPGPSPETLAAAAQLEAARVYAATLRQHRDQTPRLAPDGGEWRREPRPTAARLEDAVARGWPTSEILAQFPVSYHEVQQARRRVARINRRRGAT